MKKLLLILAVLILSACSKSEVNDIDQNPILKIGKEEIDIHDNRIFSFPMKKDSIYTLLIDFTNCLEKDKGYFFGLNATIWMDWGIDNQSYVCGPSFHYSGIEDYRNPKFALCIIPQEDFIYKLSNPYKNVNYDGNFSISIYRGEELFTKGILFKTIVAGDYSSKNIPIISDSVNKICFDFSKHTFDSDGAEPNGWLNQWFMEAGRIESEIQFYVGTIKHPRALIPKTAIYIVPFKTTWIKVKINDTDNSDDLGIIKYGYTTESL